MKLISKKTPFIVAGATMAIKKIKERSESKKSRARRILPKVFKLAIVGGVAAAIVKAVSGKNRDDVVDFPPVRAATPPATHTNAAQPSSASEVKPSDKQAPESAAKEKKVAAATRTRKQSNAKVEEKPAE